MPRGSGYGFFPAGGTDYSRGQEPELARRLTRLGRALRLHLIGISGYRSPQHSVAVGGFANDPHTRGQASDTPGIEGVGEATLRRFGLTRPFPGAAEADHIQLLGGGGAASKGRNPRPSGSRSLASLWVQAGGPRNLAPIMEAIAMAESSGRMDAVGGPNSNGTYDYGPWQINSVHSQFDKQRLISDPLYNARAAVAIYRSQGLGAWSTYNSGAYRRFLGSGGTVTGGATFGRTRPGGDTGGPDGIDQAFASYVSEGAGDASSSGADNVIFGIPGTPNIPDPFHVIPDFNPLDIFKNAKGAVNSTLDFLKWMAWILHPRNILRIVEFITGFTLMAFGIHTAIQVHRHEETTISKAARTAVDVTPVGRSAKLAKAARTGKQTARTAARTEEVASARKRGFKKERAKQKTKSNEAEMNRRFGGVPF